MKLSDLLTEEELTEAPGYVDTFDPINRDFYLLKPADVNNLVDNLFLILERFLTPKGREVKAGIKKEMRQWIDATIHDIAIPNIHKSDFYKAALKDYQALSRKGINE